MTYNSYMEGVDILDSKLGKNRIRMKTKKWYHKLFYHLVDLVCVNSWLLWQKNSTEYISFIDFKSAVADSLCRLGKPAPPPKKDKPPVDVLKPLKKKKLGLMVGQGPPKIADRLDGYNHLPVFMNTRARCKYPKCTGKSNAACQKCNVTLCFNRDRNCFLRFHVEN